MSKLEDLRPNASVRSILPNCLVSVVSAPVVRVGGARGDLQDPAGTLANNPPDVIWNGFQADDYVLSPGSDFEETVRAAHEAVTGHKAEERILPAVTDRRFYGRYYDIPSLCYGPTGAESHGFDEYVDLDSVKQTTITIAECIQRWCRLRTAGDDRNDAH